MDEDHTTIVMERFLSQLARLDGSASVEPIIKAPIGSSCFPIASALSNVARSQLSSTRTPTPQLGTRGIA